MTSRILGAGTIAVALAGFVALGQPAAAATPPGVLVVAQSIDDAVSFDPAEGYELTTVQTFNNVYHRLVQTSPTDGTKLEGALAESWEPAADGKSITFKLRAGREIRDRQSGAAGRRGLLLRPGDQARQDARSSSSGNSAGSRRTSTAWSARSTTARSRSAGRRISARPSRLPSSARRSPRSSTRRR